MIPADILAKRYPEAQPRVVFKDFPKVVFQWGNKLGELIMLSRISTKAKDEGVQAWHWCNPENEFLSVFQKYIPNHVWPPENEPKAAFQQCVEGFNCGNGNLLQQTYRYLGLKVDSKPRGLLNFSPVTKIRNRVGIHIDGVGAGTLPGFPFKRDIYPQNIELLQKYVLDHPQYDWVQFGLKRELQGVRSMVGADLDSTFREIASCEYLVCLNSAFMHVGAATDCKLIVIINNPDIEHCYLPVLKNEMPACVVPYNHYDIFWCYPQACHLHQDGENELVPRFSERSIDMALAGEVYPFWQDNWLDMVYEWVV